MNRPPKEIHITEIDNGWVVAGKSNDQKTPPTAHYAEDYEQVCQVLKQHFPPSKIVMGNS